MATLIKYTAKFSDRTITRGSERTYTHAYLIQLDNNNNRWSIQTGFAASRELAEKAARGHWLNATEDSRWIHMATGKQFKRSQAHRDLCAAKRKANPIIRLEIVEVQS